MENSSFGFQWHVTDRCNGRCRHCYQDDFSPAGEPSAETLRKAADAVMAALHPRRVSVNVTGGEPLLFPHLVPFLRHLEGFGHLEEVNLITNGTVTSLPLLKELAALPRLRTFKVSVESGDESVHDAVRGRGSFARVCRGIAEIQAATGRDVVLMVTLGRHNTPALETLLPFARRHGAAGVIFERFVPLGAGTGMRDQVLGPREWGQACLRLARLAGLEADADDLLPYTAFWLRPDDPDNPLIGAMCNLGGDSMGLMPDGSVYPCRRLPIPVGNVYREPFPAILERLEAFRPDRLRPRLQGRLCRTCPVAECSGCRAMAAAVAGDWLGDDPACPRRLSGEGCEGE